MDILTKWKIIKTGHLVRRWYKSVEKHCDTTDAEESIGTLDYIWTREKIPDKSEDSWFEQYMNDLKKYDI